MSRTTYGLALSIIVTMNAALFAQNVAPKRYALIVGVNDYAHSELNDLEFAENDAKALADRFRKAGYTEVVLLMGRDAVKAKIESEMDRLLSRHREGDTMVVCLTGHGLHFSDLKDSHFCPQDAKPFLTELDTLISIGSIYDRFRTAFEGPKLLLVDACRNDPDRTRGRGVDPGNSVRPPNGVLTYFSCSRGQRSFENKTLKHGLFSYALLETLDGRAGANTQGEVTWARLMEYLPGRVEELRKTHIQGAQPQIPSTNTNLDGLPPVLVKLEKTPDPIANNQPDPMVSNPPPDEQPMPMPMVQAPVPMPVVQPPMPMPMTQPARVPMNILVSDPVPTVDRPREPQPGEERSIQIADGIKLIVCYIPSGKATLGTPATEKLRDGDEAERDYQSNGYWLGKYEVTQDQWLSVMGSNPSYFQEFAEDERPRLGLATGNHPVERVCWDECLTFIRKINRAEKLRAELGGKGRARLPHEDEWEYAYRGGKGNRQPFYWGNSLNGDKANTGGDFPYGTNLKGKALEHTTPVGKYASIAPHPWGLCDMSGNVWEWCDNLYSADRLERSVRGGSCHGECRYSRGGYREGFLPTFVGSGVGFRILLPRD